jgi:hypothetical protein
VLAAVGVYEHRLLDRVVRGRVWIGLVTFALLGIVTLQLGLLQLNGSIGRELQRRAQLLRENSALSIENSSLASDEHVMSAAAQAGMVPISIKALRFLNAHGASTARAVEVLRAPVQPASSESSAASSGGEASSSGEASSGGEASSSGEASAGSEGSASAGSQAQQPEQSAQSSGAAASGPASSESGPAEAAVSEAGGSSSSAGGGG